jgi:hypothetical protein
MVVLGLIVLGLIAGLEVILGFSGEVVLVALCVLDLRSGSCEAVELNVVVTRPDLAGRRMSGRGRSPGVVRERSPDHEEGGGTRDRKAPAELVGRGHLIAPLRD